LFVEAGRIDRGKPIVRLLVTGGTGFIGSRLALAASGAGHEVVASGLTGTPPTAANAQELQKAGIRVEICTIDELVQVPGVLERVDAVIHLAAAQHEMNVPDAHFHRVNVAGTAQLLAAAKAAGVGRFVHGSTIGVYGGLGGVVDENTQPAPENIYGVTKLEAERLVLAEAAHMPVVVVRISEVYGPGDRRLLKLFKAVQRRRFFHLGGGRNLHHPIYIDDLVRGLLLTAEHPAAAGQLVILPGKDVVTTDEMVAAVALAVRQPSPTLRLPLWPFLAAAGLLEATLRPIGIQPPLHRRRMDFFRKSFQLDGSKALGLLGFAPLVGFVEGAQRTSRWYQECGML
jgi:nucleoside-diphosphate-sugar epimerase